MSKMYLATFASGIYEVYILTLWSVDVQSFSGVYPESFDPCVHKPYFSLVFLCLFSLIPIGIMDEFVFLFPLTLD